MSEPTGPIEKILAALTDIGDIVKAQELTIGTLQARIAELEKWNAEMVAKAASGGTLEGYREMGQRIAELEAENERITAQFIETKEYYRTRLATEDKRVDRLKAVLDRLGDETYMTKQPVMLSKEDLYFAEFGHRIEYARTMGESNE